VGRPFCVQTTKRSDTVRIVMGDVKNDQSSAGRPRDPRLDAAIINATVAILTERGYNELSVAQSSAASRLTAERLERAKATGELRSDVDTSVLASLIDGPVLHAVLGGMAQQIDDEWIAQLVNVVLNGARPEATTVKSSGRHAKSQTHTNSMNRKVTSK